MTSKLKNFKINIQRGLNSLLLQPRAPYRPPLNLYTLDALEPRILLSADLLAVSSIELNNGEDQRSVLRDISIVFDQDASAISVNDLRLRNTNTGQEIDLSQSILSFNQNNERATWTFPSEIGDSLPLGNYLAILDAESVMQSAGKLLDGDNDGQGGDSVVSHFHRLPGDTDGDRDSDQTDLSNLTTAFQHNSEQSEFNASLDFDNDNDVDYSDLFTYAQHYQSGLTNSAELSADLSEDTAPNDKYNNDNVTRIFGISGQVNRSSDPSLDVSTLWVRIDNTNMSSFVNITHLMDNTGAFELDRAVINDISGEELSEGHHVLYIQAKDLQGRLLSAIDIAFYLDQTGPSVIGKTPDNSSNNSELDVDVFFSEAVTNVDNSSLNLSGAGHNATINTVENFGSNFWRFNISDVEEGTVDIALANNITDIAGNILTAESWQFESDLTAPTVVSVSPTADGMVDFTSVAIDIKFSETVSPLRVNDLVLIGAGAQTISIEAPIDLGNNTWRYMISELQSGEVTALFASSYGSVKDLKGNYLNPFSWTFTVDNIAPEIVSISPVSGDTIESNVIDVNVEFSEAIRSFDVGDILLSGPASRTASVSDLQNLDSNNWRFRLSNLSEGTLIFSLSSKSNPITDSLGNTLTENTTTYIIDAQQLTVIAVSPSDSNSTINTIDGGAGNDSIIGFHGDNTLIGGEGDDSLFGGLGNDKLAGGPGQDILYGEQGNDVLEGGIGNDFLYGNDGDDTLSGGEGSDKLTGGGGNDTYVYYKGDGSDDIINYFTDATDFDRLRLIGVNLQDVNIKRSSSNLLLEFKQGDEALTLVGWFNSNKSQVDEIVFEDITLTPSEMISLIGATPITQFDDYIYNTSTSADQNLDLLAGDDEVTFYSKLSSTVLGGDGDDRIIIGSGDDVIEGGSGNDNVNSGDGDDTITGGLGADILNGAGGNDIYHYQLGDGNDEIRDASGIDTLYLNGISSVDASYSREDKDLVVSFSSSGETITILSWFSDYSPSLLEAFIFSDRTVEYEEIMQVIVYFGTENNDSLLGGRLDDLIYGLSGNDNIFGYYGSDTLVGGQGADRLYGDYGDDVLQGGSGDDTLDGFYGNDILQGGSGDDTLYGGTENDILEGGSGDDTLYGGDGDDILDGGQDSDYLYGGRGSNTYIFNRGYGHDVINNESLLSDNSVSRLILDDIASSDISVSKYNDDFIITILGSSDSVRIQTYGIQQRMIQVFEFSDQMLLAADIEAMVGPFSATEGDDYFKGSVEADIFSGLGGNDILNGGDGNDLLSGGSGNDQLKGDNGNDVLTGDSGDDYLQGGNGNDVLTGDSGDDSLYGGLGADTYHFANNFGSDTIFDSDPDINNLDQVFLTGISSTEVVFSRTPQSRDDLLLNLNSSFEQIKFRSWFIGDQYQIEQIHFDDMSLSPLDINTIVSQPTSDNNYIDGSELADSIDAKEGDDSVKGGLGDDILFGGLGNDSLFGEEGADQLYGQEGEDFLEGGDGDDHLYGGEDNDRIYDYAGSNHLEGGTGDDVLTSPGDGQNVLIGGDGNDTLEAGNGGNSLDGGIGDDVLKSGDGQDILVGGSGNDKLEAGIGNDSLDGGAGDDWLDAGGGDDILSGGSGTDTLLGGPGSDIYYYSIGDGNDTISEHFSLMDVNRIEFGSLISSDVNFYNDMYSLLIKIIDTGETLKVNSWFSSSKIPDIAELIFADAVLLPQDIDTRLLPLAGTLENDFIDGSSSSDILHGLMGNDRIFGNSGDDKLYGDEGDDDLRGGEGNDTLYGGLGDDRVDGITGNNTIYGGPGNDTLIGGTGNDSIYGGPGNDTAYGSLGSDTYIFERGDGFLRISGQVGLEQDTDRLELRGILSSEVVFSRDQYSLFINIIGSDERITVDDWFKNTTLPLELLVFDDVIINTSDLGFVVNLSATSGDDFLSSSQFDSIVRTTSTNIYISLNEPLDLMVSSDISLSGPGAFNAQIGVPELQLNNTWLIPVTDLVNGDVVVELSGNLPSTIWTFDVDLNSINLETISELGFGYTIIGALGDADWSRDQTISGIGDFNGDGYSDFAINTLYQHGYSYIVLGGADIENISLVDLINSGKAIRIVHPQESSDWKLSISSAGDFNYDGLDDVVIGVPGETINGDYQAGRVYVVFGRDDTAEIALSNIAHSAEGLRVDASNTALFGTAVSSAGDFNNDGFDDIVVGSWLGSGTGAYDGNANGQVHVLFGGISGSVDMTQAINTGQAVSVIGAIDEQIGTYVSGVGDVNLDGFDDISFSSGSHIVDESTYVLFGGNAAALTTEEILAQNRGAQFIGPKGGSIPQGIGDFDGDGRADIAIGANNSEFTTEIDGKLYVVTNIAAGQIINLDAQSDGVLEFGGYAGLGANLASIGDYNRDGFSDILTNSADNKIQLIYGGDAYTLSTVLALDAGNSINFNATNLIDYSGIGDFNGDGYIDLAVINGNDYHIVTADFMPKFDSMETRTSIAGNRVGFVDINGVGDYVQGASPDVDLRIRFGTTGQNGIAYDVNTTRYFNNALFVESELNTDFTLPGGWHVSSNWPDTTSTTLEFILSPEELKPFKGQSLNVFHSQDGITWSEVTNAIWGYEGHQVEISTDSLGYFIIGPASALGGPVATLAEPIVNVTSPDQMQLEFVVNYEDVNGTIDTSSLGNNNILLTGPNGYQQLAELVELNPTTNATLVAVTYRVDITGWPEGEHTLSIVTETVTDNDGISVAQTILGSYALDLTAPQLINFSSDTSIIIEPQATITLEFSEPVFGFSSSNIELTGAAAEEAIVASLVRISNTIWQVHVEGLSPGKLNIALINANEIIDISGFSLDTSDLKQFFTSLIYDPNRSIEFSPYSENSAGLSIFGPNDDSRAGMSVSGAGDVNGDGLADYLVAAYEWGNDPSHTDDPGKVYVVFGSQSEEDVYLNSLVADSKGIEILGVSAADNTGFSVSTAGDFNNDGFADVMIGTPYADEEGRPSNGKVYIVYGNSEAQTISLSTLVNDSKGSVLIGQRAGDFLGWDTSYVGDVNNDGFDDVLVGAPSFDYHDGSKVDAGAAYLVFGTDSYQSYNAVDFIDPSNSFGKLYYGHLENSHYGYSVSGIGDFAGTGDHMFAISAPGANGYNESTGEPIENAGSVSIQGYGRIASGGAFFEGTKDNTLFGLDISGAGDVNGDGYADFIVGAQADIYDNASIGEAYIVYGEDTTQFSPFYINLENATRINGVSEGDFLGVSVSAAGDINGDGFSDVIIGAFGADQSGSLNNQSGQAYVLFGSSEQPLYINVKDFVTKGEGLLIEGYNYSNTWVGYSVAGVGDVNGDGYSDVLVGAPYRDIELNNDDSSGAAYLVYGSDGNENVNKKSYSLFARLNEESLVGSNTIGTNNESPDGGMWLTFTNDSISDIERILTRDDEYFGTVLMPVIPTLVEKLSDTELSIFSAIEVVSDTIGQIWHVSALHPEEGVIPFSAEVSLHFIDTQIQGLDKNSLRILYSKDGVNWQVLDTDVIELNRNKLSATVADLSDGYLTIGKTSALGLPVAELLYRDLVVVEASNNEVQIVVNYYSGGSSPIAFASIDNADILVKGPNGYLQNATLVSTNQNVDANVIEATYQITSGSEKWIVSQSGDYEIILSKDEVSNQIDAPVEGGILGTFTVDLEVPFADSDVELAVREALGLESNDSLRVSMLAGLSELHLDSNQVDDLSGIEYAINLESLTITPLNWGSSVPGLEDLTLLQSLTKLSSLTLQGLGLTNTEIAALSHLSELDQLDIRYNAITSLTGLEFLRSLDELKLYGNEVTDLSPLAGALVKTDIAPQNVDLASTMQELVQALNYDPVKIYEWVYNHIDIQLYAGLMKGAQATFETQAGNAWDQANLLATLLDEAGVETRVVSGQAALYKMDLLTPWLGIQDHKDIGGLLHSADMNPMSSKWMIDHVWVEALLPGSNVSHWQAMDPSYKEKAYQAGIEDILELVPFDQDGYLSQTRRVLPLEWYEQQLKDYLSQHYPDKTIADVGFQGPIIQKQFEALPILPFATGEIYGHYSDLDLDVSNDTPETEQLWQHVTLKQGDTVLFSERINIPENSLEILSLSYAVSPLDTTLIASYGGLKFLPDGAIQVTPELRIGDMVLATGPAIAWRSAVNIITEIESPDPTIVYGDSTDAFAYREVVREAGQYHVIAMDALQYSGELIARQTDAVIDANRNVANGGEFEVHAQVGGLLGLANTLWSDNYYDGLAQLTNLTHYNWLQSPQHGIVTSEMYGDYYWDLMVPFVPEGALIDVSGGSGKDAIKGDYNSGELFDIRSLSVLHGSALEHDIWETLINTEAMSTVKALQTANEQGIPVFEINAVNMATYLPQLNMAQRYIDSIERNIVEDGAVVLVPRDEITLKDWVGIGWYAEEANGSIGAYINGDVLAGGGEAAGTPELDTVGTAQEVGETPNSSTAGDPVNINNGNYTHDETDFVLPNVGIPLAFARHYDSQGEFDNGMGRGWMFTYGDYLSFDAGNVTWHNDRGYRLQFVSDGQGGFTNPDSYFGNFSFDGTDYSYRDVDGLTHTFNSDGQLIEIRDRNDNAVLISYDSSGHLIAVTDEDATERQLTFNWAGDLLTSVGDFTGRTWEYTYSIEGILSSVTSPSDTQTQAMEKQYTYYTDIARNGWIHTITEANGGVTTFDYYTNGKVFSVTLPDGASQHFYYSLYHGQTDYVDEQGQTYTYSYNDDGNMVSLVNPDRTSETFVWEDGLQMARSDEFGTEETFKYDGLGNLTQEVDKAGIETNYTYESAFNQLASMTHLDGRNTTYNHDAKGNIIRVEDALGQVTTMTYNDMGQLVNITTPLGNETVEEGDYTTGYTYNDAGQVLSETTDYPTTITHTYDAQGNRLSTTDANNLTRTQEFDLLGRVIGVIDPLNNRIESQYDATGNLVSLTDALGLTTTFLYDIKQNVVQTRHADGTYQSFSYDAANNQVQAADELGRVTQYIYDDRNRMIQTIAADGARIQVNYDGGSRVVGTTDALGNTNSSAYDTAGRLVSSTDALGNTVSQSYDTSGRLVSTTDQEGRTTLYTYDLLDRAVKVEGEAQQVVSTEYDANGHVVKTTQYDLDGLAPEEIPSDLSTLPEERQRIVSSVYDVLGRVIEQTDSLGNNSTSTYDNGGRLIKVTDERGESTHFGYDDANNLVTRTNPDGGATTYAYDAKNQRISLLMPKQGETSWAYDSRGRIISETDPTQSSVQYFYDPVNNLIRQNNPDNNWVAFNYDDRNRLTESTREDGGYDQYQYDDNGNLISAINNDTELTMTYDQLNRQESESLTIHQGTSDRADDYQTNIYNVFNKASQLIQQTDHWGRVVDFVYDSAGRLESVTSNGGESATITYTGFGQRGTITYGNGAVDSFNYDGEGNLERITMTNNIGVSSIEYERDEGGLPTLITEVLNTQAETLTLLRDEMGRVESVTATNNANRSEDFGFDSNGNLLDAGALEGITVDDSDRMQTDAAGNHYTYDEKGNLTSTLRGDGTRQALIYNDLNQLVMLQEYNNAEVLTREVQYFYDSAGRRVQIIEGSEKTYQVYAGERLLGIETQNSQNQYSNEKIVYLSGLALDDVFAARDLLSYSDTKYIHRDGIGSVRLTTDDWGNVSSTQSYSVYGNALQSTGTNSTGLGYTARPTDEQSGYVDLRVRFYDPVTGRFMSEDPVSTLASGLTLYNYAINLPLAFVDLTGLTAGHPSASDAFGVFEFVDPSGIATEYSISNFEFPNNSIIDYSISWIVDQIDLNDTTSLKDLTGGDPITKTSAGLSIEFSGEVGGYGFEHGSNGTEVSLSFPITPLTSIGVAASKSGFELGASLGVDMFGVSAAATIPFQGLGGGIEVNAKIANVQVTGSIETTAKSGFYKIVDGIGDEINNLLLRGR